MSDTGVRQRGAKKRRCRVQTIESDARQRERLGTQNKQNIESENKLRTKNERGSVERHCQCVVHQEVAPQADRAVKTGRLR